MQNKFFIVFGGLVFLMIIAALTVDETPNAIVDTKDQIVEQEDEIDDDGAWAFTQVYIEGELAPKETDFPWSSGDRKIDYLGGGVYEVESYVDTKNSFNADIRKEFKGKIKKLSEGRWSMKSFRFY
jgi:hypothetical protein